MSDTYGLQFSGSQLFVWVLVMSWWIPPSHWCVVTVDARITGDWCVVTVEARLTGVSSSWKRVSLLRCHRGSAFHCCVVIVEARFTAALSSWKRVSLVCGDGRSASHWCFMTADARLTGVL